jgi:hypothetical protein
VIIVASFSPFSRHLLLNLRTSLIVVGVVAVGLFIYARFNNEELEWEIVAVVALGMVLSSIGNAIYDAKKKEEKL